MLVTSIFSFFYNVFYANRGKQFIFQSSLILSPETAFNLDKARILLFGKGLYKNNIMLLFSTRGQIFSLVQIQSKVIQVESIC